MTRIRFIKQLLILTCFVVALATLLVNLFSAVPLDRRRTQVTKTTNSYVLVPEVQRLDVGPKRRVYNVSCSKIVEGDKAEIKRARSIMQKSKVTRTSDLTFVNLTRNCDDFRKSRDYNTIPISEEELDFPIAYNILLYRDIDQTERLLRAIYRKHNAYCIHVDASASSAVRQAMTAITRCLDNVFMVSKAEDIIYEGFSRLKADLNCMEDLVQHSVSWKYLINIPSQQFPLKSNSEIVKILKIYNGANDVEGITVPGRMFSVRYKYIHKLTNRKLVRTSEKKGQPPHNITLVKGSAYGVFSRPFVQFVLKDKRTQDLLEWSKDVRSPDEYFWATVHHSKVLKAPGSYTDDLPDKKPWLAVYAAWGGRDRCHGKFVRGVCIFGVEDLTELVSKKELFANKFYIDYQPLTLDCLEEYMYNKSFNMVPFETFYYRSLSFIKKS